jgi:magnesium transporter
LHVHQVVIPIQFVLFNLSAIVGSAILYGDFKRAKFHQFVTFLYGCAATFAGVFIIAWDGNGSEPEDDDDADTVGTSGARDGAAEESARDVASTPRVGRGSLGKRRRLAPITPGAAREPHSLRHHKSAVSLVGLSTAQVSLHHKSMFLVLTNISVV